MGVLVHFRKHPQLFEPFQPQVILRYFIIVHEVLELLRYQLYLVIIFDLVLLQRQYSYYNFIVKLLYINKVNCQLNCILVMI
jgi:hypothetical protein